MVQKQLAEKGGVQAHGASIQKECKHTEQARELFRSTPNDEEYVA